MAPVTLLNAVRTVAMGGGLRLMQQYVVAGAEHQLPFVYSCRCITPPQDTVDNSTCVKEAGTPVGEVAIVSSACIPLIALAVLPLDVVVRTALPPRPSVLHPDSSVAAFCTPQGTLMIAQNVAVLGMLGLPHSPAMLTDVTSGCVVRRARQCEALTSTAWCGGRWEQTG